MPHSDRRESENAKERKRETDGNGRPIYQIRLSCPCRLSRFRPFEFSLSLRIGCFAEVLP